MHFARFLGSVAVIGALAVAFSGSACRVLEPSNKPIDGCRRYCEAKAKHQCSDDECARGCELILDRILEREGQQVVDCVASTPRRCTDVVWADCAARIGPHLDGGPPGPAPPVEEE
jgi:hypothetical protein